MPLRRRISLAAAAAAAFTVAIAVVLAFVAVRDQLLGQMDDELRAQAVQVQATQNIMAGLPGLAASAGGPAPYYQIVLPNRQGSRSGGGLKLPNNEQTQSIADGVSGPAFTDITVGNAHLRMYTFTVQIGGGGYEGQPTLAVELARPLSAIDNTLSTLRLILGLLFFGAIALAALLARLAARRVLTPLSEVTATAELIGETDDLSQRITVRSDDEVGQLAERFNEMLERLEHSRDELDASVSAQRQLVADASHELRTPVTSLRTNVEVLLQSDALDPEDRRQLLADVVEQSEELTTLVSDLIEVARGDLPSEAIDDVRLDLLVEEALARARRHAPGTAFHESLTPTVVEGNPERLSRAINNLLDNAARHTAPGTPVEVTVNAAGLRVRDHGAGIDPQDLPHVFDRFYRGANSRASQGSGLGLAIVRQVAEQHRGSVKAANMPDGGALFMLRLPTVGVEHVEGAEPPLFAREASALTDDARAVEAAPQERRTEDEYGDSGEQNEHPVTWHAGQHRH